MKVIVIGGGVLGASAVPVLPPALSPYDAPATAVSERTAASPAVSGAR